MYTDYSTARINHNRKQAQFTQEAEADRAALLSKGSSPSLPGLARDKVGDGLITIGKLLKSSSLAKQSAEPCR